MAMSASLARRELDVQRYPVLVVVLVPMLAIFVQVLVPRFIPRFDIIDLPLLVTIYFSVGWRNPIAGTGCCPGSFAGRDARSRPHHWGVGRDGHIAAVAVEQRSSSRVDQGRQQRAKRRHTGGA